MLVLPGGEEERAAARRGGEGAQGLGLAGRGVGHEAGDVGEEGDAVVFEAHFLRFLRRVDAVWPANAPS